MTTPCYHKEYISVELLFVKIGSSSPRCPNISVEYGQKAKPVEPVENLSNLPPRFSFLNRSRTSIMSGNLQQTTMR